MKENNLKSQVLTKMSRYFFVCVILMASGCEHEVPEPPVDSGSPGGTGGSSVCGQSYQGPSSDPQLDSFCAAAYAYRCIDGYPLNSAQVKGVCDIYNSIKEPGVPACPYCK